ncbi:MAG: V-type ATP synthase subunit D [Burkholderiales bacterium]
MSDVTPTRSVAIALKDERRTMQEGYAFLDEKCLLLAGAMLREVRLFDALRRELLPLQREAMAALQAAIGRHGLNGLQCYPPSRTSEHAPRITRRSLLGVTINEAELAGESAKAEPAFNPSPEAEHCRTAFTHLLPKLTAMAALAGNLERLYQEYRRTVRRVRALQDVLLPEIGALLGEVEARLEELEQDEALWVRLGSTRFDGRGNPDRHAR